MYNRLKRKTLPGFTLIELSIVMIIIGILLAAVFKGQDLIDSARLQATLSDFNRLKLMMLQYKDQFSYWPGNDPKAAARFGENNRNGDGIGIIQAREIPEVWKHLASAKFIDSSDSLPSRVGGHFFAQGNPNRNLKGNWIILSGAQGTLDPLLTPKQALQLKSKLNETDPDQGQIRIIEGTGDHGGCLDGKSYKLNNNSPACVALMPF